MSSPRRPNSRFTPYKYALEALSTRTKTPIPSLLVSFAILHELTAIIPLVSLFLSARALGIGEQTVAFVRKGIIDSNPQTEGSWVREKSAQWVTEGEQWAARVGRRYGVFGFPKGQNNEAEDASPSVGRVSQDLVGDVANAVFAYGMTKALLPARIGLSMYLSPGFSRRVVEPTRKFVLRTVWRR